MKKLLYLLSFISSFAFAQTTVRMSATATGTNTYSALFNPNVAAFNSSTIYVIPFTNANSSGTITLDPDSGGPGAAVSIKGDDGNDLAVGAIKAGGTYQFKFNGTLLRMIGSAGGAAGWNVTGRTVVTDPVIDGNASIITLRSGTGADSVFLEMGDGYFGLGNTTNLIQLETGSGFTWNNATEDIIINAPNFSATTSTGSQFDMTSVVSLSASTDVTISAGTGGSGKDIALSATAGGITATLAAPLTINGDAGTSGDVLQSNGTGSAPTWQAAAGSISDVAFGVGWDGNTTDGASKNALYDEIILKSPLASPTFTGTPTLPTGSIATTQSFGNNTTAIATTAFVQAAAGTWIDWSASLAPTGFSGTPTTVSYYIDDGKSVHIWIGVSGTSNATTMTVTLPVAPNAVYTANGIRWLAFVTNNGANATGRLLGSGSSTTLTIDANLTTGAWTASGTKALFCEFTYMK